MEMMPDFSNGDVKKHVREILQMFVGHGRGLSWTRLAELTCDGDSAVQTWERRLRSYVDAAGPLMPLDIFMRVFTVLPGAAFERFSARMGFSTAPREIDDEATVRRAIVAAARFAAKGAEALEDGHVSHIERADLANDAMGLGPIINSIAGAGSAPH